MPYYKGVIDGLIESGNKAEAGRVADTLLRLRTQLKNKIPERNVSNSILLATWNIREFGRNEKRGKRLPESLLYIAEIISRFDLIAIQEVNENLEDLQTLMKLLGSWWEYMFTDVTIGPSGNYERIAYVYDGRKVKFDHLAGELALPPKKGPRRQPARSPFICSFRTGWRRISLCSVHIYYGTSKPNDEVRVEEIRSIAEELAKRNDKRQSAADGEPDNVILLGDFNIFNKDGDQTSQALTDNHFVVPKSMRELPPTNLGGDKYFDQIAFHDPGGHLQSSKAGVFDFSQILYKANETESFMSAMTRSAGDKVPEGASRDAYYKEWRTFQISDHLPLWLELKTDFSSAYLAKTMHTYQPKAKTPKSKAATKGTRGKAKKSKGS